MCSLIGRYGFVKELLCTLERGDGSTATEDGDKANILNDFFSSVLTTEDTSNIPNILPSNRSNGKFVTNLVIEESQVKEKLSNLNPNKSPGPDKLYPRVLKELSDELAGPLAILFNMSIENSTLPKDWKLAEITAYF